MYVPFVIDLVSFRPSTFLVMSAFPTSRKPDPQQKHSLAIALQSCGNLVARVGLRFLAEGPVFERQRRFVWNGGTESSSTEGSMLSSPSLLSDG